MLQSHLRPRLGCIQINTTERVEASPLVADGIMYLSEPGGSVTALDTLTGRPLWKYTRTLAKTVRGCCGPVNRGVAILNDTVYVGTYDAHLVALDIKSGIVRWDSEVADPKLGYSITGAPLAIRDKIVVGMAGRRIRHPRLHRRLRRENRQACLAILDGAWRLVNPASKPGRATLRRPALLLHG